MAVKYFIMGEKKLILGSFDREIRNVWSIYVQNLI